MKSYVFINVEPGKSTDIVGHLRAVEWVMLADVCWGLPDIIPIVEVADLKALQDFVLTKIQNMEGVNHTDTHIAWYA